MPPARRSTEVVGELLRAMTETVVSYHPTVGRTGATVEELICGTACFPGGAGLWRGKQNAGPLPEYFPEAAVMFIAHNFDSERGFAISRARGGEAEGEFWTRLLRVLDAAHLQPDGCFFSNALMGLKPDKAEGDMPSVPGYREQCQEFLKRQVEIVRPCAVIALGAQAIRYVANLDIRHLQLLHPGDWRLRPLESRDKLLVAEGEKLHAFLGSTVGNRPTSVPNEMAPTNAEREFGRIMDAGGNKPMTWKTSAPASGTDAWGFRLGTRNASLMQMLEEGGKTKEEIRLEFEHRYPDSKGKSTFSVFFTDVIRPFGSASVSRCLRIKADAYDRLYLDPERMHVVKAAISAGILAEISALEGSYPKRDPQALQAIAEKFHAPRK